MRYSKEELFKNYMVSVQNSLLGYITSNLRMVLVGWENEKELFIRLVLDKEPTNKDIIHFSEATLELAADYPWVKLSEDCIFSLDSPKTLLEGNYSFLVYLRYEKEQQCIVQKSLPLVKIY